VTLPAVALKVPEKTCGPSRSALRRGGGRSWPNLAFDYKLPGVERVLFETMRTTSRGSDEARLDSD